MRILEVVLPSSDPTIVHSSPLMWSHALDRMIDELVRDADVDWSALRAISGSAQQHGSVYVNAGAASRRFVSTSPTPCASAATT